MAFNFNDAADPPDDYTASLQWDHPSWRTKIGGLNGSTYVVIREVREEFLECLGYWPTLDESHGVPVLLDHAAFNKYCYHVSNTEEFQADAAPDEYIPIDFEDTKEERDQWEESQIRPRFLRRYVDDPLVMLGMKPNPIKTEQNQAYIRAVKECDPGAIREIFSKGTSDIDPNCLEHNPQHEEEGYEGRMGVLAYALDNLYGEESRTKDDGSYRNRALECFKLVLSLKGVDVNMDSWCVPDDVFPPIVRAALSVDIEVVRLLLDAGARPNFPDAKIYGGEWVNLTLPRDYPTEYYTSLHLCVTRAMGHPWYFPHHLAAGGNSESFDKDLATVLEMLIGAGAHVLVKAPGDNPPPNSGTALEMLEARQRQTGDMFPRSEAVLVEAEAKARPVIPQSYQTTEVMGSLNPRDGTSWATIVDLDEGLQRKVSQYADIVQWRFLKQTAELLACWPKPPPPVVDYQLISFSVCNGLFTGYFGVAKTLADVIDAIKWLVSIDTDLENQYISTPDVVIPVRFLCFDAKHRIVPLLQWENAQYVADPNPPELNEFGTKFLGVKEAINKESFPYESFVKYEKYLNESPMRSLLSRGLQFQWDEDNETNKLCPERPTEAALMWLEGVEPSRDINLNNIGSIQTRDRNEDEVIEAWLNPDIYTENTDENRRYRRGMPRLDPSGNRWAVFDHEAHLYDP